MAQESDAQELTKESLPEGFEIIPLPGHFFDMVSFRTPDDVVYLADAVTMKFEQYVLVGSAVRSYLAWLNSLFENNMLLWQRV